jgi:alanyl-tRNA synthetase
MTTGLTKTGLVYLKEMQTRQARANAVRVFPEKGSHAYLMLDKTIFHPKGGGQPSDHGTITSSGFTVSVKRAIFHSGVVVHCLAKTASSRVETTDSWLDEPCYVGYGGRTPNAITLEQVQDLANSMISIGALVRIEYLTPEQSKSVLQNAPNFERLPDLEEVRTVTIAGCDPIPCGGTHVLDIKEIGRMSVLRGEQVSENGYRLYFSV